MGSIKAITDWFTVPTCFPVGSIKAITDGYLPYLFPRGVYQSNNRWVYRPYLFPHGVYQGYNRWVSPQQLCPELHQVFCALLLTCHHVIFPFVLLTQTHAGKVNTTIEFDFYICRY